MPERLCECENPNAALTSFEARQVPGYDETNGRFGEVSVLRCCGCRRFWLRYFLEYEGIGGSGRWGRGLIDEWVIDQITPENAIEHLHALPWYLYGGSYWKEAGRTSGPSRWDP